MLSLLALVLVRQLSGEPPETTAVRRLIDTELISVSSVGWEMKLRHRDQTFTLADEEWGTAFALVPEAQALAASLRQSHDFGMTMFRVGIGIELAGLAGAGGLALMALTIGTALLPVATIVALALVCAGLGVVGAVVALIGVPALVRAQRGTLELVSSYNHGLARQPLLSIPLGP
jgi:hypothetical protein